jgi:hypothetical protein
MKTLIKNFHVNLLLLSITQIFIYCNNRQDHDTVKSTNEHSFVDSKNFIACFGCRNETIYVKMDSVNIIKIKYPFEKIHLNEVIYIDSSKKNNYMNISIDTYKKNDIQKTYCSDLYVTNFNTPRETGSKQNYTIAIRKRKYENKEVFDFELKNIAFPEINKHYNRVCATNIDVLD